MASKQIKVGAVISYLSIFVNIVAMLFYTPWMKDQVGLSDYALFNLAHSFVAMFLMDFGIGAAVARFVAKYRAQGDQQAVNDLVGLVYKLFLLIDLVIFAALVVLYFFIDIIYEGLTPAEIEKFRTLYLIIGAFSVFSFPFTTLNGIFNAYEQFVPLKMCDMLQKLLSTGAIILVLLFGGDVISLVTVHALSGILAVLVKWVLLKRTTPVKANFRVRDRQLLKAILSFSIWTSILGIAQRLTYNIAPTILGNVSNTTEIAVYSPASAVAGYFYTFAAAINGLFLPTISRKIVNKQEGDILPLMVSVGRFQVVVLGLLYTGFATVGREFMSMWMGPEFAPAYECVLILALPTIVEYSQQIANTTIIAKNKVKLQALGLLGSSLINLIIGPLLASAYGAIGVSLGILITAVINIVYLNIVYYKVLGINVFRFAKQTYTTILIPIVGGILLSKWLTGWIALNGWGGLALRGAVTAAVFLVLVLVLHTTRQEKRACIQKLFGKK